MKTKPTYSIWQNEKFVAKGVWKYDKAMILFIVLQIIASVAIPAITVFMPKAIIDQLVSNSSAQTVLLVIAAFTAALIVANIVSTYSEKVVFWRNMSVRTFLSNECWYKVMETDYENIENPKNRTLFQKATDAVYAGNNSPMFIIVSETVVLTISILGLLFFGGLISTLNPLLIVLLLATSLIRYIPFNSAIKYRVKNEDSWADLDKKLNYISNKSEDFANGKDVRLYKIEKWFMDLFGKLTHQRLGWAKKMETKYFTAHSIGGVLSFIRDGIAYGYLIYMVLGGSITVADMVLYFGAIAAFSDRLISLSDSFAKLNDANIGVSNFRDFLDMRDTSNRANGKKLPQGVSIRFENVSFKYPESDNMILENFNLEIKQGEKLAVVGRNGAGKTTAIKLMCGLYKPTSGRVLVDGVDISEFNYKDYFSLFTAVFQDINVLPISIAENISLDQEADIEKIRHCLKLAGLLEKVDSLDMGLNTPLVRGIDEKCVDLSGGEMQKLMLARALYTDRPFLILDEPTAALDPIAEQEMYTQYDEMTSGKTSIYISHRLASTRFCDNIALIENGIVEEYGSHNELMQKQGRYAKMFDIQSYYYQKQLENKQLELEGLV